MVDASKDCYEEKRRFVQEQLTGMLYAATGAYVRECWYERKGAIEVVNVAVSHSAFDALVTFSVNVTADSLWAIAKDVMKAVGDRYE